MKKNHSKTYQIKLMLDNETAKTSNIVDASKNAISIKHELYRLSETSQNIDCLALLTKNHCRIEARKILT
jgi:hypothetical protein